MVKCTKCLQERSDEDFCYRKSGSRAGQRIQPCVSCRRQDYVDNKTFYKQRNHERNTSLEGRRYFRIYARVYYAVNRGQMSKQAAERYYRNREVITLQQVEYRRCNRQKMLARYAARNAVRNYELVVPNCCQECGTCNVVLEKHHLDYTQPLLVVWLCTVCHGKKRRKEG